MVRLKIKNIGPIKDVTFNLNKLNVFIGPQSCGKSTIAKIVSFCSWLEKNVILRQGHEFVDLEFMEKELYAFHNLRSYFNEGSYIEYNGYAIKFVYCYNEIPEITALPGFDSLRMPKVAYIPSERNIVSLPGIASLPFAHNNIRSFVFDWLNIHAKYNKENPVPILDLDIKYYFQEGENKDILLLPDGKAITIEEASSGMQSIVPLYVYLHYLTEWIYNNPEDVSFDKQKMLEHALGAHLIKRLLPNTIRLDVNTLVQNEDFTKKIHEILQFMKENKDKDYGDPQLKSLIEWESAISKPASSDIIIEEPEQNLFPKTQVELVYDILKLVNTKRDTIVITTHSPYILYALNNCMLGWEVRENIPEEDRDLRKMEKSFVNPGDVSVWEIKDGMFASDTGDSELRIQDEKGLIRRNYFDRIMQDVMADFNTLVNYYD